MATSAGEARARRLLAWLPFVVVTLFGLFLVWPAPRGVMPLSADHTVHLTRAYLYGEQLAGGHLVGWSPTWFFGFPLGELYPVLGDLGVLALRVLSLGLLDWPSAYALLFTLVFLTQGWALLRCGRALGWGPVPGLVAALLVLADVGAYREGGWIYTVTYGVWPQALATSLAWLAFAELVLAQRAQVRTPAAGGSHSPERAGAAVPSDSPGAAVPSDSPVVAVPSDSPGVAVPSDSPCAAVPSDSPARSAPAPASHRPGRHLAYAALAAGGALLAHPMAMLMFAVGAPLYLVSVGLRGGPRREQLATTLQHLTLGLGLGAALAAWWLLPMSAHSGWMASYGWLHAPLADMLRMASAGQWTQTMPAAVGHCASLGLLIAALFGRAPLRFFALWTICHWLLASTDVFWGLRLDLLSGGFQHIQYQRFLIAAKPGFFLLAGAAVGGLVHLALRTWSKRHVSKAMLAGTTALLAASLGLAGWQLREVRTAAQRHHVGELQTERLPGDPAFAADYAAFLAWARETWEARDEDHRMAFRADRNAHWFMDAPVTTQTPSYKLGFTPGDNFVHKPESGDPALLRRLGVRHLVGTGTAPPPGGALAERFGKLHVFTLADPEPPAHLEGPGSVVVEQTSLGEGLRVRVTGAQEASRLVLHVAGYPRWRLIFEPDGGEPEDVEWFEAPVLAPANGSHGEIATQAQRRAGELRGGKALGDDGREPTLIAAPARDGVYSLHYDRWGRADLLGLLAALLGLVGVVALLRSRGAPLPRLLPWARRLSHPAVVAGVVALALLLAGVRHRRGAAREHDLASARLQRGEATATRALAGPLKTDMIIFPAVLAAARPGTSEANFKDVALGANLEGWYAIDDDDAKQRRRGNHRLRLRARASGSDGWTPLADLPVPHRPDRRRLEGVPVPLALQGVPVELQIEIESTGEAPPKFGLDLTLHGAGA